MNYGKSEISHLYTKNRGSEPVLTFADKRGGGGAMLTNADIGFLQL